MQLSSRFPVAVQMLVLMTWCPDEYKLTSEVMALSVNTNPALIRRIMGYLKNAGLVMVPAGTGGARLAKDAGEITLLDVYRAVELTDNDSLFALHETTNPHCPIGKNINKILTPHLEQARNALEESLQQVTIQQISASFPTFDPIMAAKLADKLNK